MYSNHRTKERCSAKKAARIAQRAMQAAVCMMQCRAQSVTRSGMTASAPAPDTVDRSVLHDDAPHPGLSCAPLWFCARNFAGDMQAYFVKYLEKFS